MFDKWLKCKIEKGMFSDESVVVFSTSEGELFSAFVPNSAVVLPDRLKVRVFEEIGRSWAVIPNDDQTIIDVQPGSLIAA